MRLRYVWLYLAVLLVIVACLYAVSLSLFENDGLPLNTSGFRYPIA